MEYIWFKQIEVSTIQQIHHRLKIGVVINKTLRIVVMLHFSDFICLEPKQEEVLFANMFQYFQSIGTSVLPVKLDYYELEKAGKKKK